jgi:hypothetical protein
MSAIQQRVLKTERIEEFYHDMFVTTQVRDFVDFVAETKLPVKKVIDIGGGCGFFADALAKKTGLDAHVVDMDPGSVAACIEKGVPAELGDALNPTQRGDEDVVSFNLILHHLVAASDAETEALQKRAVAAWQGKSKAVFVNEYIYDSYIGNTSGWLIYRITASRLLSALGQAVAKFAPSLRANTFGTGVRFRANQEWINLFDRLGFKVAAYRRGSEEHVSLARKMLMIKSCRRDSYLLVAK